MVCTLLLLHLFYAWRQSTGQRVLLVQLGAAHDYQGFVHTERHAFDSSWVAVVLVGLFHCALVGTGSGAFLLWHFPPHLRVHLWSNGDSWTLHLGLLLVENVRVVLWLFAQVLPVLPWELVSQDLQEEVQLKGEFYFYSMYRTVEVKFSQKE